MVASQQEKTLTLDHSSDSFLNREQRFDQLEAVIERGLKAFYEVGKALTEIRDDQLYKEKGYSNFRKYCEQRWGLKKSHAYRAIKAAEVFDNLVTSLKVSPIGDNSHPKILPTNEAQIRPLTRLQPNLQREAWLQAVENSPHGKITAKDVQKVAKQVYSSQFQKSQVQNPPTFPKSQVGDCVQIRLRNRSDRVLNQYDGEVAIVEEVNENSMIVQVWGQVLPPLFPDEVKPAPLQTKVTAEIKTELIGKLMMMGYNSLDAAIEDFLKS